MELEPEERAQLIVDIATRAGTAREIASWYDTTPAELRKFVAENQAEIDAWQEPPENESEEPTPTQLSELWVTNKFERLKRLQRVADAAMARLENGAAGDATLLREFRSYMALAANELGQLLHRGSGENADGEVLEVIMRGIDTEQLK